MSEYTNLLLLIVALLLALCIGFGVGLWQQRRRHSALIALLDGADNLESVLHEARTRMAKMRDVVGRVAPDIGAVAQASLEADGPVQQGLRNLLEHRLWIAKHAPTASYPQLRQAVTALRRSHEQIAAGLRKLESAGAELAEAARAVEEQEAREPAALRRTAAGDND
ncbi:hypothetical protein [Pseudomarimonas arenosa]|uniref:Uncharacterized protein n=1 Tax=Pseudomarimonas arenosa TaxID=2774145 RepID=A0AAW3ZH98_9GAMM|nr:hypothetical protein [Pseudomarimonas arenosa]MBD8524795.1 hypothetical protein [Pseudomarimonas arenosa]